MKIDIGLGFVVGAIIADDLKGAFDTPVLGGDSERGLCALGVWGWERGVRRGDCGGRSGVVGERLVRFWRGIWWGSVGRDNVGLSGGGVLVAGWRFGVYGNLVLRHFCWSVVISVSFGW